MISSRRGKYPRLQVRSLCLALKAFITKLYESGPLRVLVDRLIIQPISTSANGSRRRAHDYLISCSLGINSEPYSPEPYHGSVDITSCSRVCLGLNVYHVGQLRIVSNVVANLIILCTILVRAPISLDDSKTIWPFHALFDVDLTRENMLKSYCRLH